MRLSHILAFLMLVIATLATRNVSAQSFKQVYAGSDLYCAQFPNGAKELVKNVNGDFQVTSTNAAAKPLASEISKIRADQQRLNELISTVQKDGTAAGNTSSGQKFYDGMQLLMYGSIVDLQLPADKVQALTQLRALEKAAANKIVHDTKQIDAIENFKKHCKKDPGNFFFKVVVIRMSAARVLVGAIYYTFNPTAKAESACLQIGKKPNQIQLGEYSLVKNPCASGGFDCKNQLRAGELGFFYAAVDDSTTPSQDTINSEIDGVEQTFENGLFSCQK